MPRVELPAPGIVTGRLMLRLHAFTNIWESLAPDCSLAKFFFSLDLAHSPGSKSSSLLGVLLCFDRLQAFGPIASSDDGLAA